LKTLKVLSFPLIVHRRPFVSQFFTTSGLLTAAHGRELAANGLPRGHIGDS
jgi:hypothetical protein